MLNFFKKLFNNNSSQNDTPPEQEPLCKNDSDLLEDHYQGQISEETTHLIQLVTLKIIEKIPTYKVAYQFVLEEIEAASQGNALAKHFAQNSGIFPEEYQGAMCNSFYEVDGPGGPQQTLLMICSQFIQDAELMVFIRTSVVDNIMKMYSLGKYKVPFEISPDTQIKIPDDNDLIILAISRNSQLIYFNENPENLFIDVEDKNDIPSHQKLDGRVVNFMYTGEKSGSVIEIFIAFPSEESFALFTLQHNRDNRFFAISNVLFPYLAKKYNQRIFSFFENYSTHYIYTFHCYQLEHQLFLINNMQTRAYLINTRQIMYAENEEDIGRLTTEFWGK